MKLSERWLDRQRVQWAPFDEFTCGFRQMQACSSEGVNIRVMEAVARQYLGIGFGILANNIEFDL